MCAAADRSREAGFSLVEVLCAMAIAAASIVVLSNGAAGSLRGVRALDMHLGARVILQSILEDGLAAAATAPGERQGESGPYRWALTIARSADGAGRLPPPHRMYRLTANVSWGKGSSTSASVLKLAR